MAGRWKYTFWGSVSIVVGAWFGYVAMRVLFSHSTLATAQEAWFLASFFPRAALAVYFVWVGNNQLQRASAREVRRPRLGWGRLLLGFTLVFAAFKGHFAPGPNILKPDNEAEAGGMLFITFVIGGVGLLLMALAFIPPKEKPAQNTVPTNDTTGAS